MLGGALAGGASDDHEQAHTFDLPLTDDRDSIVSAGRHLVRHFGEAAGRAAVDAV